MCTQDNDPHSAALLVTSARMAVVFSSPSWINDVHRWLIFGIRRVSLTTVAAGVIGLYGVMLIFFEDVSLHTVNPA